jgi:hypothetical protein
MKTARTLCAAACLALLFVATTTVRSEPKGSEPPKSEATAPKKAAKAAAAKKARPRLPKHYGQLGLTPAQKDQVYAVQAKYQAEIAELQKKLNEVRALRDKDAAEILSEDQKKHLAELTAAAKEPAAGPKAEATEAKGD